MTHKMHTNKIKKQKRLAKEHGYANVFDMVSDLYEKHKTSKKAGEIIGVAESTFWYWMREHGVKIVQKAISHPEIPNSAVIALKTAGYMYKEIAVELGVSKQFVASVLSGHRKDPAAKAIEIAEKNERKCTVCGAGCSPNRWYCNTCHTRVTDDHNCNGGMASAAYNL